MNGKEPDTLSREFIDFYDDSPTAIELLNETRYIDREFIAEGAIKNVYKVYDTHCSRTVALAVIKDNVFTFEQAVDFIREVQTTSLLEHSNIIRIYDIGITDNKPWFTMQYLAGRDLESYLNENPSLTLFELLDIFRQLCDAISYAHSHDILHLDLKPHNVNIGDYKEVILCDWGISSSTSEHSMGDLNRAQTSQGYIKGSPGYMAPEQAMESYQKHITADIYGLGALLYFLLTGNSPVAGNTASERFESTINNRLRSFKQSAIPPRLIPVFQKALSTRPEHRYQSASELKAEIENYQSGYALETESSSFPTQLALFVRRNKTPSVVVSLLLILLVIFTSIYISEITHEKVRTQAALVIAQEERKASNQAKSEAEHAKSLAESALESYRKEQRALNEANNELADLLMGENLLMLRSFQFDSALESALAAHKKRPTPLTRNRITTSAFVLQKFDLVNQYAQGNSSKKLKYLYQLSKKYADKEIPLPVRDYSKIYSVIKTGFTNLPIYFLDQCAKKLPPKEFAELLAFVISDINKQKPLHFTYDARSQSLDLRENGNIRTTITLVWSSERKYQYNLLSLLPIKNVKVDDNSHNRAQSYRASMPKDFRVHYF